MLEALAHAASVVAPFAALAAPPAALLGLAPRLGPGRAIALALGSRFSHPARASQRGGDVAALRALLASARDDQYVVVAGPKGVGKTCLVETATAATCGVVSVRVEAGASEKAIIADAFSAVTRCYLLTLGQRDGARRVLWWHAFLFRAPATVVLHASERKAGQAFADLDSAARALAHEYGVRVIIDASNNSLPDSSRATKRQSCLDVEPMERGTLEALPELGALHAALAAARVADVVWACVGGNPADYRGLDAEWERRGRGDARAAAAAFVERLVDDAANNVLDAVVADARSRAVFDLFCAGDAAVPYAALAGAVLVRPSPDKVLRVVQRAGAGGAARTRMLVPADAATAVVLRHRLTAAPPLATLEALVRGAAAAAAPPPLVVPA
jgi:hypothetical protein